MTRLNVILNHDLLPWERDLFSGTVNALRLQFAVEETDLLRHPRKSEEANHPTWLVTRRWKDAVRQTKDWPSHLPILITVLESAPNTGSWHSLLWEKWEAPQGNQQFLCLSPFTFRFLGEMEGITKSQLHFVPLPFFSGGAAPVAASPSIGPRMRVGTFSRFTSEENLHHAVTVAHYVAQRNPHVEFCLMGYGNLARHLRSMVSSLNLDATVTIRETTHVSEIQNLDVFLYIPVRNDHFGPLLYAAQYGLPVIANEVPGIEDFIIEGKTGFVVPPHDTRTLGELILRMQTNLEIQTGLSQNLRQHLGTAFSTGRAADRLARIFSPAPQGIANAESIAS